MIMLLQVDGIYACVSKTTKQDDYATIKVFDNEVLSWPCCLHIMIMPHTYIYTGILAIDT